MNSLRSCSTSGNTSFPLKTSIVDVNAFYSKINNNPPDISGAYTSRTTNPAFIDSSRTTGEIDESLNSIRVTYNKKSYNLVSVQLTKATHTNWLPKSDPTLQINNKIDIIITLENNDADPRFFIIVVPLVIDNTVTVDNAYLMGLADLTAINYYSIQSIFIHLTHYLDYTTCLEPHGDNAFVYVNTDGLKISQLLYNSLLAIWKNQDLSALQKEVQDTIGPLKDTVQKYLKKITSSTDAEQIKTYLNNLQVGAQVPSVNPKIDTWSKYTPPYDIILNVPAAIFSAASTTTEGFSNSGTASSVHYSSGAGLGGTKGDIEKEEEEEEAADTNDIPGPPASWKLPTNNVKCVQLDPDTIIDSSGNINFDDDGNMILSDVQKQRNSLRASAQLKGIDMNKYTIWFIVLIAICIVIFLVGYIISNVDAAINYFSGVKHLLPTGIENIGLYTIILIIFSFTGFIIGAAINGT